MTFHSPALATRWHTFTLAEQLGNIGSEVSRAIRARNDPQRYDGAISRALQLFEFTIDDPRWRKRLKELTRARELFRRAACNDFTYHTTLEDLDKYFYYFAYAARAHR